MCYLNRTYRVLATGKRSGLDRMGHGGYNPAASPVGAVAQLGERLNGIQEVRGSIPLGSTNIQLGNPRLPAGSTSSCAAYWWLRTGQRDQLASKAKPVSACEQHCLEAFLHKLLARSGDGSHALRPD